VLASLLTVPALIIAGIVFVILFVILSVPLWVSFVAAGGALVLYAVLAGGGIAAKRS
jgi:hypothetical protein